jgi:hypothetical protein
MEKRDLDTLKSAIEKARKLNSVIVDDSEELKKSENMVQLLEKEKKFKEDLSKAADAKQYQELFDLLDVVLELGMPETVPEVKRGMDIRAKIEEVTKKLEAAIEGEGDASSESLGSITALLKTATEMELGGKFDVLEKASEFLKSVEALRAELKAAVDKQAVPKAIELMTKAQKMKMDGEIMDAADVLCGTAKEVMETLRTVLIVADLPALPPLDENGRVPKIDGDEEAPQLLDVVGLEKSLGDAKRLKLDEGFVEEAGEDGEVGESPGETIKKASVVMEKVSKVLEKLAKFLEEAGVSTEDHAADSGFFEADVIGKSGAKPKVPAGKQLDAAGYKEQLKSVVDNLSESRNVRLDPSHPVLTGGHRLRVQIQLQILVEEDKAFGPVTTPPAHVDALDQTLAEATELGVTKSTCTALEPATNILSYHLGRRDLNDTMSRVQAQRSEFYENTGKDETSEAHLLKLHQLVEQVHAAQKACDIAEECEEVVRSQALCEMIEEEDRILATIEAATMKRNLAELSHTLLAVDKLVKQGDGYVRDRAEVVAARELQKELLSVYHNDEVVLQGFLQKEGEKNKSMKKRFFVLQAGLLKYFDKEGGKEKGEINMLDVYVVKHDSNGAKNKIFNIELKNIKRIFMLQADSSEEAQNWCDMIRNCALAANLLHTGDGDGDLGATALPGPNLDRETEVRSVAILQMLEDLKAECKSSGLEPGEQGGGGTFKGEIHRGRLTAGNILVKDDLEHIDLLYRFTETMHLMAVLCIREGPEGNQAAMFCFEDDDCTNYTGVLRLTPDSKCNIAGIADHAMQVVTPWCLVFWVASNEEHMEVWYAKIRETLDALNQDLISRKFQSKALDHIPVEVLQKAKKAAVDARTYEVTFKEKMMLGFKVKPKGDNWALVSDSNAGNGIAKGSVLMAVNERAVLSEGLYAVYEKELKEWTPPIIFKFRQPASGGGALYTTRGGKWKRQYSFLESGVMRFFRIEGSSATPVELESFFNLEGSCVRPIPKTAPIAHNRDHCFVLMGSCGQLVCQCHDSDDRNTWVATLYYAIAMANGATFVEAAVAEDDQKRRTVTSKEESKDTKAQQEHEERAIKCIASDGGRPAQVKEGWLNKRSIGNRVMHNWKKRFFRLSFYGKLVYYVSDEESMPSKGSILLTWDMTLEESTLKKHCISIKSKETEVYLQAESQAEMNIWMAALRKVVDMSTASSDYSKTRFVT